MARRKQGEGTEIQPYDELLADRTELFQGNVQVDYIFRRKVLKYSVKKSTEDLGISTGYGYRMSKQWDEDPKFRARIMKRLDAYPQDYKSACRTLLPTILKTEIKGLKAMNDDPELIVKHPQLLKQMKIAGGIDLNEAPAPVSQTINIAAIQQHIFNSIQQAAGSTNVTDAINVELTVIDDETGEGPGSG
jgi:hypothetical protein